jgi:hypothetical protein
MSNDAMPWDPFQREMLEAMGHVLWTAHDPTPPLVRALSRAANVPVSKLPALPSLHQLATPAAKRALWPQLRALRKAARG